MVSAKLDADFDDRRTSQRIDPERQADLPTDFIRQRRIKLRKERLRPGRRQFGLGGEIDHQPQPILRDAAKLRAIGALRIGLIDVDQRGNIAGHRRRQVIIDHFPLPLDEHERDQRLQHHHRHNDDEQRAGVQPFWQHRLEPQIEAAPAPGDRRSDGSRRGGGVRRAQKVTGSVAQAPGAAIKTGHGVATKR